jgi:hypothetical protein
MEIKNNVAILLHTLLLERACAALKISEWTVKATLTKLQTFNLPGKNWFLNRHCYSEISSVLEDECFCVNSLNYAKEEKEICSDEEIY